MVVCEFISGLSFGQNTAGGSSECEEHGPHTNAWVLDTSCPAVTNSPSLTPNEMYGNQNEKPCEPTIVLPIYDVAKTHMDTTWDCPPRTKTDYGELGYSVGKIYWEPPLPASWRVTDSPAFTSSAYVDISSSDTNLCAPDPVKYPLGTVKWNISGGWKPFLTIDALKVKALMTDAQDSFKDISKLLGNTTELKPSATGNLVVSFRDAYCDCNGPSIIHQMQLAGEIGVAISGKFPIPGCYWGGYVGEGENGLGIGLRAGMEYGGSLSGGANSAICGKPTSWFYSINTSKFAISLEAGVQFCVGDVINLSVVAKGEASWGFNYTCTHDESGAHANATFTLNPLKGTADGSVKLFGATIKVVSWSGTLPSKGLTQAMNLGCIL